MIKVTGTQYLIFTAFPQCYNYTDVACLFDWLSILNEACWTVYVYIYPSVTIMREA